ncbi:hypothetical protein [Streptomyces sp. NPDC059597]|uniref:hypothetical protein n=1 Tax=Streptomyces sp. NPDC059597 TaxID=3346879 RepID=UPI0036A2262A
MIDRSPHTDSARPPSAVARRDLLAALAAVLLVTAAVLVGRHLQDTRHTLFVHWPPLYADWAPHVGPGTPAALLLAAGAVAYGPALAARLSWRALPWAAWAASAAWIFSLALIDGWHTGIATRLTTRNEYLRVIGRFHDIPAALRDFDQHIVSGSPGNWPAHVAGHPPAATVTFVLLDRIGLGGGAWAGTWCAVLGASASAAVLVALRVLVDEPTARRAAPFVVFAPAAVWLGASADAYFAAVAAWALACLALAVTRRSPLWAAASGLLSGLTVYLSYGLTLIALVALAVLWLGRAGVRDRPVLLVALVAGLAVVPVVFTLLGFNWWSGYHLLVIRYYQGVGGIRPYGYWIWANLACAAVITGPATAAGLGRAGSSLVRRGDPAATRLALLTGAALLALLVADVSGMSKAETERIWLPFAMWLLPACAYLPGPRVWLGAQAVTALLVNHLLLTGW